MFTSVVFVLAAVYTRHAYSIPDQDYQPNVIPHVLHNGYLADTHEVAAAKNAHLAALATQSHGHGYEGSHGYNGGEEHSSSLGDLRYHGPTAIPHVLHDGHIADTHEVAAAKAEHFNAIAKAKAHAGYGQDYSGRYAGGYGEHSGAYNGYLHHVSPYHGPLAKPVVLKSGYLADTHEVAAAKAEHFAALSKSHAGYGHDYSGQYAGGYGEHSGFYQRYSQGVAPYHGPLAKPVVLKSGYLADTHEVAAAKAEHFAALSKSHAGYGHDYSGQYAGGYGEHSGFYQRYSQGVAPYHGPLAKPVVLKSGYLADTHEVAAAKAEHFAALSKSHAGYGHDYSGQYAGGYGEHSGFYQGYSQGVAPYHGHLANPVVLKSGYLADTHEVAVAKHNHLDALNKAKYNGHDYYH